MGMAAALANVAVQHRGELEPHPALQAVVVKPLLTTMNVGECNPMLVLNHAHVV